MKFDPIISKLTYEQSTIGIWYEYNSLINSARKI